MERQEWLDNLKIGDEVAIDVSRFGNSRYEIYKISRITPTRRFSLEGRSSEFDSNGSERGKRGRWDLPMILKPVTQEIRNSIRKMHVLARIESVKWSQFDLKDLEKVLEIIDQSNQT